MPTVFVIYTSLVETACITNAVTTIVIDRVFVRKVTT